MDQLRVTITDGGYLTTNGSFQTVPWVAKGISCTTDFLELPLKGCDMVLEVQWFLSLGVIV